MRRLALVIALIFLGVQVDKLHAVVNSARSRTVNRFRKECDEQGQGKACYDYGRSKWNEGGNNRKIGKKYLLRACELKYQRACDDYQAHNSLRHKSTKHYKSVASGDGPTGPCFATKDLEKAKFYPNMISATGVHGQMIGNISPKSFWEHVGFRTGDIITRINNQPFNNTDEAIKIFSKSGKKFSFEVERDHETTNLWYTCN